MLKTIRVSALILLLACSAQAGYMQTGSPEPPPPPPSQPANSIQEPTDTSQETSADGYMQNDAPSALTQIALEVLAVMPSLF
jgi:hypothetical protein